MGALPNAPGAIIGYRANGAPIRLIAGGDGNDDDKNKDEPDYTKYSYKQARNRLKDINDELQRIRTKETRTAEDDRMWEQLVAEAKALDEHIRNLKRDADLARLNAALEAGAVEPGDGHQNYDPHADIADRTLNPDSAKQRRFRNPYDLSEVRGGLTPKERGYEFRARALSAIESKHAFPARNDKYRETCARFIEEFDNERGDLSYLLLNTSSEEYVCMFGRYVQHRGNRDALDHDEQKLLARAIGIGTIGGGGALLPFQLDPAVVLSSDQSFNQVRRVARQVVAIADKWHAVTSAGTTSRWGSEATPATDGAPTFSRPEVDIKKLDVFVPVSIEASMDLINIAQEVARLIAIEADTKESIAFVTGAGAGSDEPAGLITRLAAAGPPVTLETAVANTFADDDVYAVDGALAARYRFNANWLAHRRIYNDVRQFDTGGGGGLWVQLASDVGADVGGAGATILGRRVYEAEAMDSDSTVSLANILVFGDFMHYVIADRVGTTVEFIPHLVQQVTAGSGHAVPTGERAWYAIKRVGADSLVDTAFRLLQVNDGL